MLSLFPDEPILPEGFSYFPDFVSVEEEAHLLAEIEKLDLRNMMFHGYEAKRLTSNFGYNWSFENRVLTKGKPIPATFNFMMDKVAQAFVMQADDIVQLLATQYPVGSVINWHRDAPPFEKIIGISLQADCIFKLRPYNKAKQGRHSTISFRVKRRSMYMLQRTAREDWEHSTAPVKEPRCSVTFRTLRPGIVSA